MRMTAFSSQGTALSGQPHYFSLVQNTLIFHFQWKVGSEGEILQRFSKSVSAPSEVFNRALSPSLLFFFTQLRWKRWLRKTQQDNGFSQPWGRDSESFLFLYVSRIKCPSVFLRQRCPYQCFPPSHVFNRAFSAQSARRSKVK